MALEAYLNSHLLSSEDSWAEVSEIEPPPKSSINAACNVIVTSLHWTTTRRHPSVLVATYLHHGIMLSETSSEMARISHNHRIVDGRSWDHIRFVAFPGYM